MPTITQLPASSMVTAADIVPVSQDGSTCGISVGDLLAGTQPAILIEPGSLLGRISVGAGTPEQMAIGLGLAVADGTLVANGLDQVTYQTKQSFQPTDALVASSSGSPCLIPISSLRDLFRPGSNISISSSGVISAGVIGSPSAGISILDMDPITSTSPDDLVAVSHAGTTYSISISGLLNGVTIGQASTAASPSVSDTFWVSQGSDVMVRQTMGSVASWLADRITASPAATIPLSADTVFDPVTHNNKILVCSTSLTLSVSATANVSGFRCEVINLSSGSVKLSSGIRTSSGNQSLAAGQAMRLYGLVISGANTLYAWMSFSTQANTVVSTSGQPTLASVTVLSSTSAQLTWAASGAVAEGVTYNAIYRQIGAANWVTAASSMGPPQCTIAGLGAGVSYEFGVSATSGNGSSSISNTITATMLTATTPAVSAPVNLLSDVTATNATLRWSQPNTGQVQTYIVDYRTSGSITWNSSLTGITTLSASLSGLSAAQSYEWRVTAVDASGRTATSQVMVFITATASASVNAITWNVVPSTPFAHGVGAVGVNAHVSPAASPVQFGLSTSPNTPPASWTTGVYVNNDLWGAYVPTPQIAGTWYAWVAGLDGSAANASRQVITVT